jgi:hypothetical protein
MTQNKFSGVGAKTPLEKLFCAELLPMSHEIEIPLEKLIFETLS